MDEKEKTVRNPKVTELREKLRNGRTASTASADSSGHSTGAIGTPGSSVQGDGRTSQGPTGNSARTKGSNSGNSSGKRSGTRGNIRPRHNSGRSDKGNSSPIALGGGGETRAAGRLVTDDPIPERKPETDTPDFNFGDEISLAKAPQRYKEDYKETHRNIDGWRTKVYYLITDRSKIISAGEWNSLTTRKEAETSAKPGSASAESTNRTEDHTKAKRRFTFGKEGRVLSQKEVTDLTEPLIAALLSDFEYLDKGIWLYSMSQDEQPIWSDMAREEVEVLASIMMKRGQHSPEAAAAVRAIVDSDVYIQVGMITIPRVIKTYKAIKGSPRPMLNRQRNEARKKARQERFANVNRA